MQVCCCRVVGPNHGYGCKIAGKLSRSVDYSLFLHHGSGDFVKVVNNCKTKGLCQKLFNEAKSVGMS